MADTIIKAFGKHIDLSKVIAISEKPEWDQRPGYGGFVAYVDVQLRDTPLLLELGNAYAPNETVEQTHARITVDLDAFIAKWREVVTRG